MSNIKNFIDMASRYPLLTQEQEIELGRRIQKWLTTENPSPGMIRSGRRARDQFVCCNLRLVIAVAKRYHRRIRDTSLSFSDLLQEGTIGLQRAAEKYDPESGYKMSTYAYWWIRQAIYEIHKLTPRQRNYICCVLLERDQDPATWQAEWSKLESEVFS